MTYLYDVDDGAMKNDIRDNMKDKNKKIRYL